MARVGLTTTIPVEVLLAAGETPVDLNNVFINHPDPVSLVRRAERDGYPRNCCGWIKGLYATVLETGIRRVVAVTQGDCSQTHAMMETLQAAGVEIIPFAFPYDRDRELLESQLRRFMDRFGVSRQAVERVREELRPLRQAVAEVDRLSWQEGKVTGAENHYWQVNCSDFEGDPEGFARRVEAFLAEARAREPLPAAVPLGFMGVPPILRGLYEFLESRGARVIFNEVQRQFTMADALEEDLVGQYQRYTYPYDVFARLADVRAEAQRRGLRGVIHYTQAFCFRQIEDLLIRRGLSRPVLTLEAEDPAEIDARTALRLEAFLETLAA